MPPALTDQLNQGISEIADFFPRLLAALGLLMVGILVAKMVERGLDIVLHRIGFDRWMREGGVTEALERAGLDNERRALRLRPEALTWELSGVLLHLRFTLPRGCFATSVVRELARLDDEQGIQEMAE